MQQQREQEQEGDATPAAAVPLQLPAQLHTLCYEGCNNLLPGLPAVLPALPHLTSLSLVIVDDHGIDQFCSVLLTIAGQLTHLQWDSLTHEFNLASCLASPAVLFKLSSLRRLEVCRFKLDDAGLSVLLASFPELTYVGVGGCRLQRSHLAEDRIAWEEFCIRSIDVASLARLPLRVIKRVYVVGLYSDWSCTTTSNTTTINSGDAAAAAAGATLTAALAADPDCTFTCIDGHLDLHLHVSEMPALLPLIARWQGVRYLSLHTPVHGTDAQRLTAAAAGALGALLQVLPSCSVLRLCGLKPHPSALLLPVLAHTSVTRVDLVDDSITEAELMAWCAGGDAAHPIAVHAYLYGVLEGHVANVRAIVDAPDSGVQLSVESRVA